MKICITSNGNSLDDQIDPRFGKAKNFIVVETANGLIRGFEVIENLNLKEDRENGAKAAKQIKDMGVEVLISCKVGPRTLDILQELGIKVVCMSGDIRANLDEFLVGEFQRLSTKGEDK